MKYALNLIIVFAACGLRAQTLEVVTPQKTMQLSLREMKKKLPTTTVKVADPVFKSEKEYDTFLLTDVLTLAGLSPEAKGDELVFTAKDGYSPNTTFDKLNKFKGYLAYQEHGTKLKFSEFLQGKAKINAAPFYLVWDKEESLKEDVPWPYQLIRIEVVNYAQKFPRVLPKNVAVGSPEMKGFLVFKAECTRCHSMNGQGGALGPELNYPKNITEYWRPDVLRAFIKNVAAFRAKDKMPVFDKLSEADLDHLIAYLTLMKDQKVAVD